MTERDGCARSRVHRHVIIARRNCAKISAIDRRIEKGKREKKRKKRESVARDLSREDFNWLFHSRVEKKLVVKGNETNCRLTGRFYPRVISCFLITGLLFPFWCFPLFWEGEGRKRRDSMARSNARTHTHTHMYTQRCGKGGAYTRVYTRALFTRRFVSLNPLLISFERTHQARGMNLCKARAESALR